MSLIELKEHPRLCGLFCLLFLTQARGTRGFVGLAARDDWLDSHGSSALDAFQDFADRQHDQETKK